MMDIHIYLLCFLVHVGFFIFIFQLGCVIECVERQYLMVGNAQQNLAFSKEPVW